MCVLVGGETQKRNLSPKHCQNTKFKTILHILQKGNYSTDHTSHDHSAVSHKKNPHTQKCIKRPSLTRTGYIIMNIKMLYSRRQPHLHNQLMSAGDESESVAVVERFRNVLTEGVSSTTWRDAPATAVIRVRPEQVTHRTLHNKNTYVIMHGTGPTRS